jgi:cytochrome c-type biogenesis protein CcmH
VKRILMVLALLALAVPVSAQDAPEGLYLGQGRLEDAGLEARAAQLASELQCPVCQGQSIGASPSPMARQMKDLIRSQVSEGLSDEQVREYFVSKYGEWVLLEPKAAGFNLVVYILPGLALLAGAGVVVTAVRRWSTGGDGEPAQET